MEVLGTACKNVGKYYGGERILSPPWFQHCGGPAVPTPLQLVPIQCYAAVDKISTESASRGPSAVAERFLCDIKVSLAVA